MRYWLFQYRSVPVPKLPIPIPVPQFRKVSVPKMASNKLFWSKITLFSSKITLFWSKITLFWSNITLFWLFQYRYWVPVPKLFRYWYWYETGTGTENGQYRTGIPEYLRFTAVPHLLTLEHYFNVFYRG